MHRGGFGQKGIGVYGLWMGYQMRRRFGIKWRSNGGRELWDGERRDIIRWTQVIGRGEGIRRALKRAKKPGRF